MLVPRQTGCFTAVLHFFKGRKRQQPDAASEAPDTFSIFPTSLPPVGGPRSRGKEQARLAGLTLGKVERTRTCLAEDDTADDDDDLRSLSTEASASRSARSHSSSLSALSAVLEGDPTRSKKVTFQGVANVVEYDAGDQGEWQKNETVAGPAAVPDSCSKVAVCGRPGSAEASRDDCDERCVPEALEWCFISVVASPYVTPVVAIGMRSVAWGEDAEWSVTESQGSDGQFRPVRGLFQLVYKLLSSSSSTLALGEGLDLAAAVPLHQDVDHPSGKADDEDADGGRTLGEKCGITSDQLTPTLTISSKSVVIAGSNGECIFYSILGHGEIVAPMSSPPLPRGRGRSVHFNANVEISYYLKELPSHHHRRLEESVFSSRGRRSCELELLCTPSKYRIKHHNRYCDRLAKAVV
ncbi:hypothetical protein FOL46_005695 [Perkinsus olseni]|uniref:Uncharacterized protein n=1 Tax=Perkinsus olseni TaxID=32597 RepID=A0A7J6MRB7_PEROL|nr:hypothetical protein FOL46_005695 [Perkinsus olseni]